MWGALTTLINLCVIAANDDQKQEQRTIVLEKKLSVGQDKSSFGSLGLSGLDKGSLYLRKSNTA